MRLSQRAVLFAFFALLAICVAQAQAGPSPRIVYSDLESGPNTGGEAGEGAIVTIYGSGFGATRGTSTVTVGGGQVANYRTWSDSKIAFRLGSAAVTGQIVVNVSGAASNGVPFTVRTGRIYFVSTTGNDSRNGTSGHAWRTLARAKTSMKAGDIVYVMNGVTETSFSANLVGASGKPMAIVAYPGATVTIGSATGSGVTVPTGGYNYWVLAG